MAVEQDDSLPADYSPEVELLADDLSRGDCWAVPPGAALEAERADSSPADYSPEAEVSAGDLSRAGYSVVPGAALAAGDLLPADYLAGPSSV